MASWWPRAVKRQSYVPTWPTQNIILSAPGMEEVLRQLINSLQIVMKELRIMSASIGDLQQRIDSLTQAVTNESTVESSAMTLISGIPQMIQDAINQALANGATPEQLAALDNLVSSINSSASNLAGAVAANTPAPNTPAPSP